MTQLLHTDLRELIPSLYDLNLSVPKVAVFWIRVRLSMVRGGSQDGFFREQISLKRLVGA